MICHSVGKRKGDLRFATTSSSTRGSKQVIRKSLAVLDSTCFSEDYGSFTEDDGLNNQQSYPPAISSSMFHFVGDDSDSSLKLTREEKFHTPMQI